jgi:hypothetical protein
MNTQQTARPDIRNDDPHKGVEVGMATGKLFESQLLGDLSSRVVFESFQSALHEMLENCGAKEADLNEAIKTIYFRDGANKGKRKWSSLGAFMTSAFGSIKSGNEKEKAEAYYDFNEMLRTLGNKSKFPHLGEVLTLLDRDVALNMSLEIARRSQPDISLKKFTTTIMRDLQQKLPRTKFKIINGLGTPMDYVQKIDFVVAVLGTQGQILRYYSYDIKTDPTKESSMMEDVVIIMPDDLQATLEERTKSSIDKVVYDVVERESKVIGEGGH